MRDRALDLTTRRSGAGEPQAPTPLEQRIFRLEQERDSGGYFANAVVTGNVIQTAHSGARVKMSASTGPYILLYSGSPQANNPAFIYAFAEGTGTAERNLLNIIPGNIGSKSVPIFTLKGEVAGGGETYASLLATTYEIFAGDVGVPTHKFYLTTSETYLSLRSPAGTGQIAIRCANAASELQVTSTDGTVWRNLKANKCVAVDRFEANSPDNTLYYLKPPNGGGTATWVAV